MKLGWRGAIGIVISAALLIYLFHKIPWDEVWLTVQRANYGLLLLTAVVSTLIFPLRARRWRTILDPVAPKLPFDPLWRATAIGMMVNNVLPARAGEPMRAFALWREQPAVPFSTAFASLAVDRVFDAIVILLLMAASMLAPGFPSGATVRGAPIGDFILPFAGVLVLALGALYGLVFFPRVLIGAFELVARRVAPRLEQRGRDALHSFAHGLSVLKSPVHFFAVLFWTILHWLTNALAFYIGFLAIGIQTPFTAALFSQGLIALGVSIPSSPGFFGVFEALAIAALGLYGVSAGAAATWAIAFHIVSFIPITVIGGVYFAKLGLSFSDLESIDSEGSGPA